MDRSKRRENNNMVHDYNQNKKPKLQHQITIINSNKSIFEHLANEILYEIFEYLDIYDVYQAFFNLNRRFENVLLHSSLLLKVNISTMSKSKFNDYYQNIIIPNRHRINILRLSNLFSTSIVFSPPKILLKFLQLERLVLDDIDGKYLTNILNHSTHLPKLHSLSIYFFAYVKKLGDIYLQIFRLPKLKYCKLEYHGVHFLKLSSASTSISSPIEHLVIKHSIPFELFTNLLSYLPRLRRLSIDIIHDHNHKEIDFSPVALKSLKHVSLKLYSTNLNRLEQIIKNYFHYIEVFQIESRYDQSYLHAKKWKQIILSYMPNLRVFDFYHHGLAENYHDLINEFNSSFWINKQWFFAHQHTWDDDSNSGIFYSINPYRRKDYTLDWPNNEQTCLNIQEKYFSSVKHLRIGGKQLTNNSIYYFPNVNELTIISYLETSNHSIWNNLNRILSLKQLTKLHICDVGLPFEQLIELLRSTPNLHTIEYQFEFFYKVDLKSIEQSDSFQYVSTRNNVKKLDIYQEDYTLEKFQILMKLFPQLEYLHIGMSNKEVEQFVQFLSSKTNDKTHPLCLFHIVRFLKTPIVEWNRWMRSKDLHDDYSIKTTDYHSYCWW